jgi:hypothetical protein
MAGTAKEMNASILIFAKSDKFLIFIFFFYVFLQFGKSFFQQAANISKNLPPESPD